MNGKTSKGYEQAVHKLKAQKVDKHTSRDPYSLIFRKMISKIVRRYQFIPIELRRIS